LQRSVCTAEPELRASRTRYFITSAATGTRTSTSPIFYHFRLDRNALIDFPRGRPPPFAPALAPAAKIVGAACAGPAIAPPTAGGIATGCVLRFFATADDAHARVSARGVIESARVSPFVASARAIELARLRMSSAAPGVAGFGAADSARGRSAAAGVTRAAVGGVRPTAYDGVRELNDEAAEAEADEADGGGGAGAGAPPRANDGARETDGVDGSELAIDDVASDVGA